MSKEKGMLQLGGLKCNNQKCFYRNEDVQINEYQEWVNVPCPDCGEILLTQEDLNTVKLLVAGISIANKINQTKE